MTPNNYSNQNSMLLSPIKDWDPRDNDIHNAGPVHLIAIS